MLLASGSSEAAAGQPKLILPATPQRGGGWRVWGGEWRRGVGGGVKQRRPLQTPADSTDGAKSGCAAVMKQ